LVSNSGIICQLGLAGSKYLWAKCQVYWDNMMVVFWMLPLKKILIIASFTIILVTFKKIWNIKKIIMSGKKQKSLRWTIPFNCYCSKEWIIMMLPYWKLRDTMKLKMEINLSAHYSNKKEPKAVHLKECSRVIRIIMKFVPILRRVYSEPLSLSYITNVFTYW